VAPDIGLRANRLHAAADHEDVIGAGGLVIDEAVLERGATCVVGVAGLAHDLGQQVGDRVTQAAHVVLCPHEAETVAEVLCHEAPQGGQEAQAVGFLERWGGAWRCEVKPARRCVRRQRNGEAGRTIEGHGWNLQARAVFEVAPFGRGHEGCRRRARERVPHLLEQHEALAPGLDHAAMHHIGCAGAQLAVKADVLLVGQKAGAAVALRARTQAERTCQRGDALLLARDVELDVHVSHLVAFPCLHARAHGLDQLVHDPMFLWIPRAELI